MSRGRSFIVIGFLLVVLIGVAVLFGWFEQKVKPEDPQKIEQIQPQEDQMDKEQTAEDQNEDTSIVESKEQEVSGVFVGDKAPEFSLIDKEGNEINLSNLKGKVVLLNFWTTWRTSCLPQMRDMEEVYERYQDKDVVIVGINVLAADSMNKEEINQFLEDNGLTFPILFDDAGETTIKYKVSTFPTTYILDKNGVITALVTETMNKDGMIEKIEDALNH